MTEFLTLVIHDQLTHKNPPPSVFDTALDRSVVPPCREWVHNLLWHDPGWKEFNTARAKASLALSLPTHHLFVTSQWRSDTYRQAH